jgi:hypothetical protein
VNKNMVSNQPKQTSESVFFEKSYILNLLEMELSDLVEGELTSSIRVKIGDSRVPFFPGQKEYTVTAETEEKVCEIVRRRLRVLIDSLREDKVIKEVEYKKRLIIGTRNDITARFPPEIIGLIFNHTE